MGIHVLNIGDIKIEYLEPKIHSQPKYYDAIHNIYLGYRTCYSKTPEIEKPFTEDEKRKLKEKFILAEVKRLELDDFISSPKVMEELWTDAIARFECTEEMMYQYLRWCWFIKLHLGHESPFEHACLTYKIKDCSRALTHQLVRCRLASYSQSSQRYQAEDPSDFKVNLPYAVLNNPEANEAVVQFLDQIPELITKLKGMGIKNEDIRAIFPNAACTAIQVTMNFRELKHFIELRSSKHAQEEIRVVAKAVWKHLAYEMPFIWEGILSE